MMTAARISGIPRTTKKKPGGNFASRQNLFRKSGVLIFILFLILVLVVVNFLARLVLLFIHLFLLGSI